MAQSDYEHLKAVLPAAAAFNIQVSQKAALSPAPDL